ncbi:hypothetical protein IMG5_184550, partial [Ichthyophthirius multifiliis]
KKEEEEESIKLNCNSCKEEKTQEQLLFFTINYEKQYYCFECKQKLEQGTKEIEQLEKQINEIQINLTEINSKISHVTHEINLIKTSEQKNETEIEQEYKQLEQEEEELNQKIFELKEKILTYEQQENEYWDEVNIFEKNLYQVLEKKQIAENQEKHYNEQLIKLNTYNTLNQVFNIQCDEQAGTINNIIIGKKLNQEIVWDETNAGLGQIAMLFSYLVKKYGYEMKFIKDINLCANESQICEIEKNQILQLYGPLNYQSEYSRFDQAIKLLLKEFYCFYEFLINQVKIGDYVEEVKLPYNIDIQKCEIDYVEISIMKNIDLWTSGMKKFLINFKYIIYINELYYSKKEIEYLEQEN